MPDIEGFILTGGASSRMGSDKARLTLEGAMFVERVASALCAIAERISVVGARGERADLRLPVVADIYRNCGALGGLHAALAACREPWAAIVSCDLPFVTKELFVRLATLRDEETEIVAPRQSDGRPQPLCTLYARAPCLRLTERLLESGELRPRVLLQEARTHWVNPAELDDLAGAELFFMNVNTPADYHLAREAVGEK